MKTTSKTLLSYLAFATALVALFATAGKGIGQNKETPRPAEIKPQAKKKAGIKVASYTPITVKKAAPSPAPLKQGATKQARTKEHSVNTEIALSFEIYDENWPTSNPTSINVTARCYLVTDLSDDNPGVSIGVDGDAPAVAVFDGNTSDAKTFALSRAVVSEFPIIIPTTHNGESMANRQFVLVVSGSSGGHSFCGMVSITTNP